MNKGIGEEILKLEFLKEKDTESKTPRVTQRTGGPLDIPKRSR
jgi:hypothetical protein